MPHQVSDLWLHAPVLWAAVAKEAAVNAVMSPACQDYENDRQLKISQLALVVCKLKTASLKA